MERSRGLRSESIDFQTLIDESYESIETAQEVCDLLKHRADESGELEHMTTWATLTAGIQAARFAAIHTEVSVKNAVRMEQMAKHAARAQASRLIQTAGGSGGQAR